VYNSLVAASVGGQTLYDDSIAREVCRRLAAGESLNSICDEDFPVAESTVRLWAIDDREGFAAKYRLAREMQADHWAEETKLLADRPLLGEVVTTTETAAKGTETKTVVADNVERSKLQVHAREWIASRMAPRRWGDRLDISGEIDCKLSVQFSIAPAPAARLELPASVRALLPAPGVARLRDSDAEGSDATPAR